MKYKDQPSNQTFRRALVLTNPLARQGRIRLPDRQWYERPECRTGCLADVEWDVRGLDQIRSLADLVRESADQGTDLVVAAGGDGTVHHVVNALMSLPPKRRPVLGILPLGTGNDFAKMIGIPRGDLDPLVALASGMVVGVDLGCCNGAWFINEAGLGRFSEATRIYHALPSYLVGRIRYVAAALGAISRPWNCHVRLSVNGTSVHEGEFAFVAVSNGAWSGGRFRMNPGGSVTDGLLDVWLCRPLSRFQLLRELPRLTRGTHVDNPALQHWSAHDVRIESDDLETFQLDGEMHFFTGQGLDIQVYPRALRVLTAVAPGVQEHISTIET